MSGENFDYKFGNKNNWRRWVWNRIVERLAVPPAEAVVLYLAGQQDLDREIAIQRGFKGHNLIAVERDELVAAQLRKKGVLTIQGEFGDVLQFWPLGHEIHVVFGDFCSDMTLKLWTAITLTAFLAYTKNAVLAFNFQRGRDQTAAAHRLSARKTVEAIISTAPERHISPLHRGLHVYADWFEVMKGIAAGAARIENGKWSIKWERSEYRDDPRFLAFCWIIQKDLSMRCHSYKSIIPRVCKHTGRIKKTTLYFDSVVWRNVMAELWKTGAPKGCYVRNAKEKSIRLSASAVLAHRTMRKNKTGIYAEE